MNFGKILSEIQDCVHLVYDVSYCRNLLNTAMDNQIPKYRECIQCLNNYCLLKYECAPFHVVDLQLNLILP